MVQELERILDLRQRPAGLGGFLFSSRMYSTAFFDPRMWAFGDMLRYPLRFSFQNFRCIGDSLGLALGRNIPVKSLD